MQAYLSTSLGKYQGVQLCIIYSFNKRMFKFYKKSPNCPPVSVHGNFLVVQWLGLGTLSLPGPWFWSLVREHRSHKPHSAIKIHTHTHTHQSECIILHSQQQQIKVPIAHIFLGIISVPDFSYSNRHVVTVYCFKLYFPDDMMWSIFSHAYLPTYFFLMRHLLKSLAYF